MTSEHIIRVSELDFEYQVIEFSRQTPVLVDFWAEWCSPCKMLGPLLERLTEEARGAFRLAKVDVDANPNLALRYAVRSIPAVKVFRDGQVVSEFVGALPEPRIREFLRALAPSQTDLLLEKGQSQISAQDWSNAEKSFRKFLANSPDFPPALLGLLRSILMQSKLSEAANLVNSFPESKEYPSAQTIRPLVEALLSAQNNPPYGDDPLQAAYGNALRLVLRGNVPAALDGLLDILRQDKQYRSGEARRVFLGLLETLGEENPLTSQYRRELSMVLF
ncbi:MAG: thioredoxin [Anaerolineales bacterium]|nr:thioredoxin [Anaerolineales bacterium]